MLSAEKQPHPSDFVRQAPGRKSADEPVNDFPLFPLHFRHFPLDYLFGAWYNKTVIPQTRHQQHLKEPEKCRTRKRAGRPLEGSAKNYDR